MGERYNCPKCGIDYFMWFVRYNSFVCLRVGCNASCPPVPWPWPRGIQEWINEKTTEPKSRDTTSEG